MYGYNTQGITQVSALGSSEASAPQRFKFISIMGDSNGGSATVRSRGGVPSREGPFSEVPLYLPPASLYPHTWLLTFLHPGSLPFRGWSWYGVSINWIVCIVTDSWIQGSSVSLLQSP